MAWIALTGIALLVVSSAVVMTTDEWLWRRVRDEEHLARRINARRQRNKSRLRRVFSTVRLISGFGLPVVAFFAVSLYRFGFSPIGSIAFGIGLALLAWSAWELFTTIITAYSIRDQRQRRVDRAGYRIDDFVEHFRSRGVSTVISSAVYHYLQLHWCDIPDVPIWPQDNLERTYGLGGWDELEEIVEHCIGEVQMPEDFELHGALDTVEELVVAVDHIKRESLI